MTDPQADVTQTEIAAAADAVNVKKEEEELEVVVDLEANIDNNNNGNDMDDDIVVVSEQDDQIAIEKYRQRDFTLYDEILNSLHGAFLMFCLPDLKAIAKEGKLKGDSNMIQRILQMPCTLYDVMTIYQHNRQLLTEERLKCNERANMYHEALALERYNDLNLTKKEKKALLVRIIIHVLDDVNEEEECVYVIAQNKIQNLVTISFRGSVTSKDFKQDAKAILSYTPNPIKVHNNLNNNRDKDDHDNIEKEALPDQVGLHLGFKEYLYGTKAEIKENESTNKKAKYKIILDKAAELIQDFNKDDDNPRLKIVGHSLGGALTTVLALEAAADERFPSPITAITSGAPKVGNLGFLQTFEYLERTERIRCIQVANNKDPVTQSPPIGNFDPCAPIFCRQMIFRHVGLRLLLNPKGFIIWHPMKAKSYPGILVFDWIHVGINCAILLCGCFFMLFFCNIFTILFIPLCCCCSYRFLKKSRNHHTQLKYIHRLEFIKQELEQLTLDELNDVRFGRSPYRLSRTLVYHRSKIKFDASIFDNIPSPFTIGKDNDGSTKSDDDKASPAPTCNIAREDEENQQ